MCQLCFINLNDEILNRTWAYASIYANSKKIHEDGFGISSGTEIYRHEKCAWNLTDWTRYVKFITDKPVMTHVRKASLVGGARLIKDKKYNHPFRTKNLILMHNGTLLRKDEVDKYKVDKVVDSEIFLRSLSKVYNRNGHNLTNALQKTMKDFYGKFAFIIYEILKDKYMIVRGKTALLHYLNLQVKKDDKVALTGFVINTDKDSLYEGLCIANNYTINSHDMQIGWEKGKAVEVLDAESIYEIDRFEFKKTGEIEENSEPVTTTTTTYSRGSNYQNDWATQGFSKEELRIIREIGTFKNKWRISLEYLDLMFYFTFGTGLLSSEEDDFKLFADKIIPNLNKHAKKEEDFLVKVWAEIRDKKGLGDVSLTKKFKLPFPYFVVDKAEGLYTYLESDSKAEGAEK